LPVERLFKASADLAATGGHLQDAQFKGLPKTIPDIALQVIRTLVQTEPDKRFQRAEEVLELFVPVKAVEQTPLPSNRELGQGETYDLFQIEALHARAVIPRSTAPSAARSRNVWP